MIKTEAANRLPSCVQEVIQISKKSIYDIMQAKLLLKLEAAMAEKYRDMNGVRKRVALTFSNRQFRRNVEHSGDRNWLQIDVGVAFKMIQDFLETVNL